MWPCWMGPCLTQINLGHSCMLQLSLHSDFPQACWLHCFDYRLLTDTLNYPIQHVLSCIQRVVLGR